MYKFNRNSVVRTDLMNCSLYAARAGWIYPTAKCSCPAVKIFNTPWNQMAQKIFPWFKSSLHRNRLMYLLRLQAYRLFFPQAKFWDSSKNVKGTFQKLLMEFFWKVSFGCVQFYLLLIRFAFGIKLTCTLDTISRQSHTRLPEFLKRLARYLIQIWQKIKILIMKTSNLLSVLNFVCSALTAVLLVVPYALALKHIFISPLILFPFTVATVISWVLCSCASDIWVKNGCYDE